MKTTLMKYALRGLLLPLLTGCHTGQELATPDGAAGGVTVRFEAAASTAAPLGTTRATADDMQLGTVVGFRFEQDACLLLRVPLLALVPLTAD